MSGNDRFRLAIVGAGMAAETLHLPAALASELVEVTAIVDPVAERAAAMAQRYGLTPEIAPAIDAVRRQLDGAVVATPNNTHRAVAAACAARGVHCLIEKPLATNVADAEEICALADRHKITIAVGYATRFRNEVVLLKQLLDCGHFGTIRRFYFQDGTAGGWSPASGFNLDREAMGGGVLVGTGTHFLDRMLYWFGFPDECEMEDDSTGGPEAQCVVGVRYTRPGAAFEGTIRLSKLLDLRPGLAIDTEQGTVVLGLGASPLVFRPHASPDLEIVLRTRGKPWFPPDIDNFQLELEDFVGACRDGRAPLVDARQGLLSMRLLEKIYANRKPLGQPWRCGAANKPATSALAADSRIAPPFVVGVFGASGFVGASLVERLRRQKIHAVPIIHSAGNAWRLARDGAPLKFCDVRSRESVADAMRGCTHIVNCTRGDDATMVGGLQNLLAEAKARRIRRFVHLSSIAVYGVRPPPESFSEEAATRPPAGSYGAIKLRQDDLVARAHRDGVECAVLCLPNISGVYSSFVCNALDDIRRGALALVEGGRMPLNIVDVENLCYAIELALTAERVDGKRMFVTDGEGITWRDFADRLAPLAGLSEPLPSVPADEVACPPAARRASLGRSIAHLASSEVRDALGRDPLIGKAEQQAHALVARLPDGWRERLRLAIDGPIRVEKAPTRPRFGSRYMEQQLRGVAHRNERAVRLLGYSPIVEFDDSMTRFCDWYAATTGVGTASWPLAAQLLAV